MKDEQSSEQEHTPENDIMVDEDPNESRNVESQDMKFYSLDNSKLDRSDHLSYDENTHMSINQKIVQCSNSLEEIKKHTEEIQKLILTNPEEKTNQQNCEDNAEDENDGFVNINSSELNTNITGTEQDDGKNILDPVLVVSLGPRIPEKILDHVQHIGANLLDVKLDIDKLRERERKLSDQNSGMMKKNSEVEKHNQQLCFEKESLLCQLESSLKSATELEMKVKKTENDIQRANSLIDSQVSQIKKLEHELNTENKNSAAFLKKIELDEEVKTELKSQKKDLVAQLEEKIKSLAAVNEQRNSLEEKCKLLEEQLKVPINHSDSLEELKKESIFKEDEYKGQITKLGQTIEELQIQVRKYQSDLQEMLLQQESEQIDKAKKLDQEKEEEKFALESKISKLSQQLANTFEEHKRLEAHNIQLISNLNSEKKLNLQFEERNTVLEKEKCEQGCKMAELYQENQQ